MLFLSSFWIVGPLFFLNWCCFCPFFKLLVLSSLWVVGPLFFLSWCYSFPLFLNYWSSLLYESVSLLSSLNYCCSSPFFKLLLFFSSLWASNAPLLSLKCCCSFPLSKMFLSLSSMPFFSSTTNGGLFYFQLLLLVFSPLSMPLSPFSSLLSYFT